MSDSAAPERSRLISLDVFRGMTIAGMTLVNNPGTWDAIYSPLEHAEWNGITPTDYIFPFFLFIVGTAIPIALRKRIDNGITTSVYLKIIQRAASIFALGLLISMIPFFQFNDSTGIPYWLRILLFLAFSAALYLYFIDRKRDAAIVAGISALTIIGFYASGATILWYNFSTMRIPGVLQRIAVCYLIVSIIFLHTNWRQQAIIGGALLLIYWVLMTTIPVPGCDVTTMNDKACNLAAYIDRTVFTTQHIWRQAKVYDPEGILSTIPAIVTTISGVLTGTWLMRRDEGRMLDAESTKNSDSSLVRYTSSLNKVAGLFFFGTALLAAGWSWSLVFPLNKSLWTSSYVLYTSGLALLTLACCYWLIDIKGYRRWAQPFEIFGSNALALFVFSGLFARLLGAVRVNGGGGKAISLQEWIFNSVFLPFAEPINASLAFAICFILFWLGLMWLLYRKRIYIKV